MSGAQIRIDGEQRTAASAVEVALVDGQPSKRIQLLKIGANPARDGKTIFHVRDQAHAERVVAASDAYNGSTQPCVDYDHQSVYGAKEGVGGQAPASGWMTKLSAEPDGIYADVEWTRAAAARLADREYRYISPYFGHTPGGDVTRIFNAALTNRPELELRAVASVTDPLQLEIRMSKITGALGLADDATEDAIAAAIESLKTDRTAVCSALGLAATATGDELRTAASARSAAGGKVDLSQYVPRAEFDSLRGRVDTADETRRAASVDDAIRAGKIAPASRDWALALAKDNPASFDSFIGSAPMIVAPGAEERRAAAVAEGKLTPEEKFVAASMGLTDDAWLKSRKEQQV